MITAKAKESYRIKNNAEGRAFAGAWMDAHKEAGIPCKRIEDKDYIVLYREPEYKFKHEGDSNHDES